MDYERFIELYLLQDADKYGRVLRGELRRRVIEWRGSNPRTYHNHEKQLVELGYLSDVGGYYQIEEPIFSHTKKRVQDKREERDRLALMQRHSFTGEVLAPGYGNEHKMVTDVSDLIERMKKKEKVNRINKALEFSVDRLVVNAGHTPSEIAGIPPKTPSGIAKPPAPQKEERK
jgi:hypothetical protein